MGRNQVADKAVATVVQLHGCCTNVFIELFLLILKERIKRRWKCIKRKGGPRLIAHIRRDVKRPNTSPPPNVVLKLAFTSRIASHHFIKSEWILLKPVRERENVQ